jgi:hypothetical protein
LTDQVHARPQAPEVAFRLLFLAPGASVEKTMQVLRLKGQEWYGGGGLSSWSRYYDFESRQTLTLTFRFDDKRGESVLVKAEFLPVPAPPPARQADQVKVKIKGTLHRVGKSWVIKVIPSFGEEQNWALDFASREQEQAARKLEGKKVNLSGEIFRPFQFPGVGGESFLVPPPEPRVLVGALKAVKKNPE